MIKDCTWGIILLKLTTDRHEALPGLSATVELLVNAYHRLIWTSQSESVWGNNTHTYSVQAKMILCQLFISVYWHNSCFVSCSLTFLAVSFSLQLTNYIITSAKKAEVMWSFCLLFCHSFCKQDNWRTRKRASTKLGRHRQGMTL